MAQSVFIIFSFNLSACRKNIVNFTAGCTAPPAGTETAVPSAAIGYAVGDSYGYACNADFLYVGDNADLTVTCQSGGTWSAAAPTCQGNVK